MQCLCLWWFPVVGNHYELLTLSLDWVSVHATAVFENYREIIIAGVGLQAIHTSSDYVSNPTKRNAISIRVDLNKVTHVKSQHKFPVQTPLTVAPA